MYHYVYLIVNTVNGKKYIGKRSSKEEPEKDPYMGSGKAIKRSQKKHGIENFEKFILNICKTEDEAYKVEEEYITVLDAVKDRKYYNLDGGGRGLGSGENHPCYGIRGEDSPHYGKKHSIETRQKMSMSRMGKNNPNYGKKFSIETRQKISMSRMGRVSTIETRQKISKANSGKNNPNYGNRGKENTLSIKIVQLTKEGDFIKIWDSISDACRFLSGSNDRRNHIAKVCKGRPNNKTAFGYKWQYLEDYEREQKRKSQT